MKILILFSINERVKTNRNTIYEHLNSFEKYGQGHEFHYLNIFETIPSFLFNIKYDAVILHYTFLGEKRFIESSNGWNTKIKNLKKISGYKIAIPQDEYDCTNRLCQLFKQQNIDVVYTCFTKDIDILKAYPFEKTGKLKIRKVFPGYIEESRIGVLNEKSKSYNERPIEIGYRGRKLPANFGKHGQLKYDLVNIFNTALANKDLKTDIKNTNDNFIVENAQSIKLGFAWYDFLLSCKAFIGCEGGSSLLDTDGSLKLKINNYIANNPTVSFEEIEANCFPSLDYNINCFALSPRHFEAAMTKTLQILVDGEYGGIFKPWIHYVPLKKDFSNIEEVLAFLKDVEGCEKIISNSYNDIVLSGNYSYAMFVSGIIKDITDAIGQNQPKYNKTVFLFYKGLIEIRNNIGLYRRLIIKKIKNIDKLYPQVFGVEKKL